MTTAQVVETSVTVNNNPIQDYVHPDDQTQPFAVILSDIIANVFQIRSTVARYEELSKTEKYFEGRINNNH